MHLATSLALSGCQSSLRKVWHCGIRGQRQRCLFRSSTLFLPGSRSFTDLAKEVKYCEPTIDVEEYACSDIAPYHIIPFGWFPECVTQGSICSIDVADICDRHRDEIVFGDLRVFRPATDESHERQKQQGVAHLKCQRETLRRHDSSCKRRIRNLVGVVSLRVGHGDNIRPDAGDVSHCNSSHQARLTVRWALGRQRAREAKMGAPNMPSRLTNETRRQIDQYRCLDEATKYKCRTDALETRIEGEM